MAVTVSEFLARLEKVKATPGGWTARCPAHDDGTPSLSIACGATHPIVLTCRAGCEQSDVLAAVGLTFADICRDREDNLATAPRPAAKRREMPLPPPKRTFGDVTGEYVATYVYIGEDGGIVALKDRYSTSAAEGKKPGKQFPTRLPNGDGTYRACGTGERPPLPLYRLLELLASKPGDRLFIAEGEKCVDVLVAMGYLATTSPDGSAKWRERDTHLFTDRHVVILADDDAPGQKKATATQTALRHVARSVCVITMPNPASVSGYDVADWVAEGHTRAELEQLVDAARSKERKKLEFIFGSEEERPTPQQWLIDWWLPRGFVTLLFALGGSSKSFLALFLAMSVALGRDVFGCRVQRGPVVYLDGELDAKTWLRRAYMVARGLGLDRIPIGLVYCQIPDSLTDKNTFNEVLAFVNEVKPALVVIDSFTACLPGQDTNSLDDVALRMKLLRELGSVLMIDHTRKSSEVGESTPFGSVAKTIFARSAIQLTSSPAGGSVLRQVKSNFGPLAPSLAYTLDFDGDEAVRFTTLDFSDDRLEGVEAALPTRARILSAFKSGQLGTGGTAREVAEVLDIPLKTVKNTLSILKRTRDLDLQGLTWTLPPAPRSPLTFQKEHS